jgi:hypothetical protein
MKTKILFIIIFLFAGLYIDLRMMGNDESICAGPYSQRAFIVQTIIPFRPARETFYFGIGNRHYDHQAEFTHYIDEETGEWLGTRQSEYGCASYERNRFGPHAHYINLNKSNPKEMGFIDISQDYMKISKEKYESWYK